MTHAAHRIAEGIAAVIAASLAIACKPYVSAEQYCERRYEAWQRAHPDQPDRRGAFIDACAKSIRRSNQRDDECRRACLEHNIKDGKNPAGEYAAMTACEAKCTDAEAPAASP